MNDEFVMSYTVAETLQQPARPSAARARVLTTDLKCKFPYQPAEQVV